MRQRRRPGIFWQVQQAKRKTRPFAICIARRRHPQRSTTSSFGLIFAHRGSASHMLSCKPDKVRQNAGQKEKGKARSTRNGRGKRPQMDAEPESVSQTEDSESLRKRAKAALNFQPSERAKSAKVPDLGHCLVAARFVRAGTFGGTLLVGARTAFTSTMEVRRFPARIAETRRCGRLR